MEVVSCKQIVLVTDQPTKEGGKLRDDYTVCTCLLSVSLFLLIRLVCILSWDSFFSGVAFLMCIVSC
jgi:hypothetical protein